MNAHATTDDLLSLARIHGATHTSSGVLGQPHVTVIFPTTEERDAWLTKVRGAWHLSEYGAMRLNYENRWVDVNGYGVTLAHFSPSGVPVRPFSGGRGIIPTAPVSYAWSAR